MAGQVQDCQESRRNRFCQESVRESVREVPQNADHPTSAGAKRERKSRYQLASPTFESLMVRNCAVVFSPLPWTFPCSIGLFQKSFYPSPSLFSNTLWKFQYPQYKTPWNLRILRFNTPLEIPLSGIQKYFRKIPFGQFVYCLFFVNDVVFFRMSASQKKNM